MFNDVINEITSQARQCGGTSKVIAKVRSTLEVN